MIKVLNHDDSCGLLDSRCITVYESDIKTSVNSEKEKRKIILFVHRPEATS